MLRDSEAIQRVIEENRSVGEKILEVITNIVEKLKALLKEFEEEDSVREEANLLREMTKVYEEAKAKWSEAFADTVKNISAEREAGAKVEADGEVRYSEGDLLTIDLDEEYNSYNLKKLNDYIYVQRKIYETLVNEGFFDSDSNRRIVTNGESGKVIEIGKKGIFETFGKGSKYETLPAFIKKRKIATIRHILEIIEKGTVIDSSKPNYHDPKSELTYSYIEAPVFIDGKRLYVSVDIRESYQKNMFWVHNININKKGQSLDVNSASKEAQSTIKKELTKDRIPQNISDVNSFEENNYETAGTTNTDRKKQQFTIIANTNPAPNSYSTWVRAVDDIKTLAETLEDSDWEDAEEFNPDLTRDDILAAIESVKITVYSSYPIKNGTFVSPSRMEAESYSGTGKVYSKTVDIRNVAWIDPTQGQYAEVLKNDQQYNESQDTDNVNTSEVLFSEISDTTPTPRETLVDALAETAQNDAERDIGTYFYYGIYLHKEYYGYIKGDKE